MMSNPAPTPLPDAIGYREAVAADALCLAVLAMQVFLDTYATQGIGPKIAREALERGSMDEFAALLADAATTIVVAEQAGNLVGFAQVTHDAAHEQLGEAPAAELYRLYVQEPFTGRGVGRELLRQAERVAAARGAVALWLTAWVGNARALAFYPRQGYAHVGDTIYSFGGDDFANKLFARRLDTGPRAA